MTRDEWLRRLEQEIDQRLTAAFDGLLSELVESDASLEELTLAEEIWQRETAEKRAAIRARAIQALDRWPSDRLAELTYDWD
jgi:hypothetical protein